MVKILEKIIKLIGRVDFSSIKYFFTGTYYDLSKDDIKACALFLCENRCFGLLRRKTHLSSFFVSLSHWFLTGRWGYWSHVWANADDKEKPLDLEIVEAIGKGVVKSSFWDVFSCDSICLLRPKKLSDDEWEKVNMVIHSFVGLGYDEFFNLKNANELSCVELLYAGIRSVNPMALPGLTRMIARYGNITPDMVYGCGDFEICIEIRR